MSLDWDIKNANRIPREETPNEQGFHEVTDEYWPVLESIIWGMLGTGVGWELTDENASKFYARYRIMAELSGFDPLKPEQIHLAVGLRTNTSPETDAAWRKRIFENKYRLYTESYNRAVAENIAAIEASKGEE